LSQDKKIGNRDHPNLLIQGFKEAIPDCNLYDLPMEGYKYIWVRRKGKSNTIEEKLGKALENIEW
ncbi:hypothetical protein glysoja_045589, partial [Glycine soja]